MKKKKHSLSEESVIENGQQKINKNFMCVILYTGFRCEIAQIRMANK